MVEVLIFDNGKITLDKKKMEIEGEVPEIPDELPLAFDASFDDNGEKVHVTDTKMVSAKDGDDFFAALTDYLNREEIDYEIEGLSHKTKENEFGGEEEESEERSGGDESESEEKEFSEGFASKKDKRKGEK